jgi:hypothetical protein
MVALWWQSRHETVSSPGSAIRSASVGELVIIQIPHSLRHHSRRACSSSAWSRAISRSVCSALACMLAGFRADVGGDGVNSLGPDYPAEISLLHVQPYELILDRACHGAVPGALVVGGW